MSWNRLSRRAFVVAAGAVGLGTLIGCGDSGPAPAPGTSQTGVVQAKAFRRSVKNKRASAAAKTHAANRLYVSAAAAAADPAHPGDVADIVSIDTSSAKWSAWFAGGAQFVDLRAL